MSDYSVQDIDPEERRAERIRQALANVNTSLPCTVKSVAVSSVDLELNILRQFNGQEQKPLVLEQVPVMFPQTTSHGVTFPIKPGDTGIALFQQRNIDRWLLDAENKTPATPRLHDLSDAVFVPGLQKSGETFIPANTTVRSPDMTIALGEGSSGVLKMQNKDGDDLVAILKETLALLSTLSTVPFVRHSSSTPTPELILQNAQFAALAQRLARF